MGAKYGGADISESVPRSIWWGWGDPSRARALPRHALELIRDRIGVDPDAPAAAPPRLSDVRLAQSALSAEQLEALAEIVGADGLSLEPLERVVHAGGKGTDDLLRRRAAEADNAPDAIVFPRDNAAVAGLLEYCTRELIAVVPFGGGTSVVGGVEPLRGRATAVITLDLTRMDALLGIDPVSRTARFQAGIRGPAVEAALAARGYHLGHLPQSHQQATLGGYAATRSAGQASTGYGSSDELITALRVETPAGTLHAGGRAPASAAGPALRELFLGSEGTLGVITEVVVSISPLPTARAYGAWAFPSFAAGEGALRELAQDGQRAALPEVCRLSDEEETDLNFSLAGGKSIERLRGYLRLRGLRSPALGLFVWEGHGRAPAARARAAGRIMRAHGGVWVTSVPARSWERGRFSSPALRDELLARGVFVETLETAAQWSAIEATNDAVRGAIRASLAEGPAGGAESGRGPGAARAAEGPRDCAIQTHISHVYRGGASLYYTFLAAAEPDARAQYRRVKAAASAAIMASGATITHHHAVGTEHATQLEEEIGGLGVATLRAVKSVLDPAGILNPGKLIPPER